MRAWGGSTPPQKNRTAAARPTLHPMHPAPPWRRRPLGGGRTPPLPKRLLAGVPSPKAAAAVQPPTPRQPPRPPASSRSGRSCASRATHVRPQTPGSCRSSPQLGTPRKYPLATLPAAGACRHVTFESGGSIMGARMSADSSNWLTASEGARHSRRVSVGSWSRTQRPPPSWTAGFGARAGRLSAPRAARSPPLRGRRKGAVGQGEPCLGPLVRSFQLLEDHPPLRLTTTSGSFRPYTLTAARMASIHAVSWGRGRRGRLWAGTRPRAAGGRG
jgi:hypothetical protein